MKHTTWIEEFDQEFDFFECAALNGSDIKAFIAEKLKEAVTARGEELREQVSRLEEYVINESWARGVNPVISKASALTLLANKHLQESE